MENALRSSDKNLVSVKIQETTLGESMQSFL